MSLPSKPDFEPRRRAQLRAELLSRAHAWLPEWRSQVGGSDLMSALLDIAARISSEVTQRLDRIPDKAFRGFFDWLGTSGRAGLAARLPVVFRMAANAEPVDAAAAVQLQVVVGDTPLVLETEQPLRILSGRLVQLVGVNPARDAVYLPPDGIVELEPPAALPSAWQLKSDAPPLTTQLQLTPALGLALGMTLTEPATGLDYRVTVLGNAGIVTIEPPLGTPVQADSEDAALAPAGLPAGARLLRRGSFAPFADTQRNAQEHLLYLGAENALNVATAAVIELVTDGAPVADAQWQFWGKRSSNDPADWLPLEPIVDAGRTYLLKPSGSAEVRDVAGHSSRWLRARQSGIADRASELTGLRMRVNCIPNIDGSWPAAISSRFDLRSADTAPAREAIANTAPLVLDAPFFPLGREPRLFDAFYLGSKEVFSKANAKVEVSFTIGDEFASPLAATTLGSEQLIVGVGNDGRLRRMWERDVADEPGSSVPELAFLSSTAPLLDARPVALELSSRPGLVTFGGLAFASVGGAATVYLYRQATRDELGTWSSLGQPGEAGTGAANAVEDTLLVAGLASLDAYAVREGKLYRRNALVEDKWKLVKGAPTEVARLAFMARPRVAIAGLASTDILFCLDSQGQLFVLGEDLAWLKAPLTRKLEPGCYPQGVIGDDGHRRFVAQAKTNVGEPAELVAFDLDEGGAHDEGLEAESIKLRVFDAQAVLRGRALSWSDDGTRAIAVLAVDDDGITRPATWDAFGGDREVSFGDVPTVATIFGAPVQVGARQLFPAAQGSAFVTLDDAELQSVESASVADALLLDTPRLWQRATIVLIDLTPLTADRTLVPAAAAYDLGSSKWAFELESPLEPVGTDALVVSVYGSQTARVSNSLSAGRLRLAEDDDTTEQGSHIYLRWPKQTKIAVVTAITGSKVRYAKLDDKTLATKSRDVHYGVLDLQQLMVEADNRPVVDTSSISASIKAELRHSVLQFTSLKPGTQLPAIVVEERDRLVLSQPWTSPADQRIDTSFKITALALFGRYRFFEPPRPRNPELLWEYWNGAGWWRIPNLVDETVNLVKSASVRFCVPADLQPTDVVGRVNHWVRARLVGGDFGQESVTLTTSPADANGKTVQQVVRSSDNILAPYVIALDLRYQVCCAVTPDFVLTSDAGSVRDQADANRSDSATVEHFVPLSQMLARLASGASASVQTVDGEGPALYLGFDCELKGGPISLLFVIEEGDHDAAYPLRVDALLAGRLQPLIVEDGTRGLNESGTLTLELNQSPQLTELFGSSCHWLRLRPNASFDGSRWRPSIRGAYLNAAWVTAAETQARELLGASDGSPMQRVTLARPPVLADSLVLRVREPLGDEEISSLRRGGAEEVLDELGGRAGPWVRWRQVTDPADEALAARVYALDPANGEIVFGDGLHGMIPPIGVDAFMAERYLRGGALAGNEIVPWSSISLLTPLAGVESVVAPTAAAGGADPQDVDSTLRFAAANLRTRGRAVTLRDFEQLALQSRPDIAQVRALATRTGLRLVVVMKGKDPVPSKATLRELRRYLLTLAAPSLAGANALVVIPPLMISLRIELRVTIDRVEWSGAVSLEIGRRIVALLDPEQGGLDHAGWPLGQVPALADVAASLVDLEHLEALDTVTLKTVDASGALGDLVGPIRAVELLHLGKDGIDVSCAVSATELSV